MSVRDWWSVFRFGILVLFTWAAFLHPPRAYIQNFIWKRKEKMYVTYCLKLKWCVTHDGNYSASNEKWLLPLFCSAHAHLNLLYAKIYASMSGDDENPFGLEQNMKRATLKCRTFWIGRNAVFIPCTGWNFWRENDRATTTNGNKWSQRNDFRDGEKLLRRDVVKMLKKRWTFAKKFVSNCVCLDIWNMRWALQCWGTHTHTRALTGYRFELKPSDIRTQQCRFSPSAVVSGRLMESHADGYIHECVWVCVRLYEFRFSLSLSHKFIRVCKIRAGPIKQQMNADSTQGIWSIETEGMKETQPIARTSLNM